MSEQGLLQAEQRVREMNRVTRQYTEQGNRFMQQNMQNMRNNQTRFEQVRPDNNTYVKDRNTMPRQQSRQAAQTVQTPQPLHIEPPVQEISGQNRPAEKAQTAGLSFLSDLNLDGEKLMIILIMYLLIKEKADIKLILALGYLLL